MQLRARCACLPRPCTLPRLYCKTASSSPWSCMATTFSHTTCTPRRPIIGSSDRYPPSSPLPSSRVLHDRYPTVSSLQLSLNMYCSRSCSLTEAGTFRGGVGLPSRFEPNLFYFMLRSFYHFSPDSYCSTCRLSSAKRREGCLRVVFEGVLSEFSPQPIARFQFSS